MLAKQYRLPSSTRLLKSSFYKTSLFSVKIAHTQESQSRFAFIVRKKVDKRAVIRNRIRRVFRACIESQLHDIPTGYDMLFFLEKGIMDKSHQELCHHVQQFLLHKKLLKEKAS